MQKSRGLDAVPKVEIHTYSGGCMQEDTYYTKARIQTPRQSN